MSSWEILETESGFVERMSKWVIWNGQSFNHSTPFLSFIATLSEVKDAPVPKKLSHSVKDKH